MAQQVKNQTRIHENAVRSLASLSGLRIPRCCACGCGCGVGQQLQLRFDPLAWELLYASGLALEGKKKCQVTSKFLTSIPQRFNNSHVPGLC